MSLQAKNAFEGERQGGFYDQGGINRQRTLPGKDH